MSQMVLGFSRGPFPRVLRLPIPSVRNPTIRYFVAANYENQRWITQVVRIRARLRSCFAVPGPRGDRRLATAFCATPHRPVVCVDPPMWTVSAIGRLTSWPFPCALFTLVGGSAHEFVVQNLARAPAQVNARAIADARTPRIGCASGTGPRHRLGEASPPQPQWPVRASPCSLP